MRLRLKPRALAAVVLLLLVPSVPASGSIVYLDQSSDGTEAAGSAFVRALDDPNVQKIVLESDYALSRRLGMPTAQITRNVTIMSAPGSMRALNFNFANGAAALCSRCTVTFQGLELANAQRLQSMPFFRGEVGSRIAVKDSYITQLACAPTQAAYSIFKDTPRSRAFPRSAAGDDQQDVTMVDIAFKGHKHENAIYARDMSIDIPLEMLEKEVYAGGFALAYQNVTRICFNAVSDNCLSGKSLVHCLDEMIIDIEEGSGGHAADQHQAQQQQQQQQQQQPQLPPGAIAGAVIGALAGLLLLVTACAACVLVRRRRRARQEEGSLKAAAADAADAAAAVASGSGSALGSALGSADPSPDPMHWSAGSFSAESINPWAFQSRKAAAAAASATGAKAGASGQSGDWHVVNDIESPVDAATGDDSSRPRTSLTNDTRGQRLTAAISSKVRNIHEHRLAAAMGAGAAGACAAAGGAADGSERRMRKLSSNSGGDGPADNSGGDTAAAAPEDEDEFLVKDVLGRGGFGVVYKAVWHGTTVAVKIMHLPPGSKAVSAAAQKKERNDKSLLWAAMHSTCSDAKSNGQNSALEDMAVQEAAISSSMAHPNIVSVYSVSLKPIRHHHLKDLATGPHARNRAAATAAAAAAAAPDAGSNGSKSRDDSGSDTAAAAKDLDLVPWEMQLIMEYCDQGTLRDVLDAQLIFDRSTGANHIPTVLSLAQQVARAMQYLHKEHVLHGDLKANNVLLKSVAPLGLGRSDSLGANAANLFLQQPEPALQHLQQPADAPQEIVLDGQQQQQQQGAAALTLKLPGCTVTAKVSDFGLSTSLDPANTHITRLGPGTLTHTAPEMLIHGHCSRASDVYAYGMLLYELATGNRVFADVPRALLGHFVVQQQLRPRWPSALSNNPAWDGIRKLTELCWAQHPPARPSFAEILVELGQLARGGALSPSIVERLALAGRCTPVSPVFPLLVPGAQGAGGAEAVDGSFSLPRVAPAGAVASPAAAVELMQQLEEQQQQLQQHKQRQRQAAGTDAASLLLVPMDSNSAEDAAVVRLSLQEAEEACRGTGSSAAAAAATGSAAGAAGFAGAAAAGSRSSRRLSVVVEDHVGELLYDI